MTIELEINFFEDPCNYCHGTKVAYYGCGTACSVCDGIGFKINEESKKLAKFLYAFYGIRPLEKLPSAKGEGELVANPLFGHEE